MGIGWNLGNTLDANNGGRMTDIRRSETQWGQPLATPELMKMMHEAGFEAIRVPVTWYPHMDAEGRVDSAWMNRVHEVVDYVLDAGMYCIINIHHDTGADGSNFRSWLKADTQVFDSLSHRYAYLWQQIAAEFRDYDSRLLLEGFNEMLDSHSSWCFASFNTPAKYDAQIAASAYKAINQYNQLFVDVVRKSGGQNRERNLIVNTYGACSGSGAWNPHLQDPLTNMSLPDDPSGKGHIIIQVHSYPQIRNLAAACQEVDDMISSLRKHLMSKGVPVIIGEWGTSDGGGDYRNNREKMFQFVDHFVSQCKANSIPTFYWMGLSDGRARSVPEFSQPDLVRRILDAYRRK